MSHFQLEYFFVDYVQLDHKVSQREIPNDPYFNQMWGLNNTGQNGGQFDGDIDAVEAWDIATGGLTSIGDEIVVAVVDGGVDWFFKIIFFPCLFF